MEHMRLYHAQLPLFLRELAGTAAMQRLAQVGMNCGCEYTGFARFRGCAPYSRLDHSVGVALIVWHFTHDKKQSVAGLLHDISTPVFAHVVDFMNGDYLTQESTESDTRSVILASKELTDALHRHGLTVDEVFDYHQYPIADNDTPQLSADRLEYTLGNALNFGFASPSEVEAMYADLTVGTNEHGMPELMFQTQEQALRFAQIALGCSHIYVSDEDRFSMEALAQLLKAALLRGILTREELHTTEPAVIRKLLSDRQTAQSWQRFCSYAELRRSTVPEPEGIWYQVNAKKRHIDPAVQSQGRISTLMPAFKEALTAFLNQSFDCWLSAQPCSH